MNIPKWSYLKVSEMPNQCVIQCFTMQRRSEMHHGSNGGLADQRVGIGEACHDRRKNLRFHGSQGKFIYEAGQLIQKTHSGGSVR